MRFSTRLLAAAACGLLAGPASAQGVRRYLTIESMVGQAESVYTGTITAVSRAGKASSDAGALMKGAGDRFEISVQIDDVIKGKLAATIKLGSEAIVVEAGHAFSYECYESWAQHRTPFLWFSYRRTPDREYTRWLVPQIGSENASRLGIPHTAPQLVWEAKRLGPRVPKEQARWNPDAVNVFSMDFSVLKTPEQILTRAHAFAKEHPGIVDTADFAISNDVAALCESPVDVGIVIFVPVVPELEAIARQWIAVPETVLCNVVNPRRDTYGLPANYRSIEEFWIRRGGIHCLLSFKSAPNQAILERLLTDPAFIIDEWRYKRLFQVRGDAYAVLQAWGVAAKQPVVEEPIPDPDAPPQSASPF